MAHSCSCTRDGLASAAELAEMLRAGRHWTLWLTASLFNAVVDEQVQALSDVEQLLVGGEALSVGHIGGRSRSCGGVQLINGYGPTEATTFSCCYRLPGEVEADGGEHADRAADSEHGSVRAGRGVGAGAGGSARRTVYRRGWPGAWLSATSGADGREVCADPFSGRAASGCIGRETWVRYLADGKIEYRGRLDQQVKVRGYRIELGEIEAVLGQHAAVAQCVVNVWQTESGDKHLVGYVVWELEQEATVTELRRVSE